MNRLLTISSLLITSCVIGPLSYKEILKVTKAAHEYAEKALYEGTVGDFRVPGIDPAEFKNIGLYSAGGTPAFPGFHHTDLAKVTRSLKDNLDKALPLAFSLGFALKHEKTYERFCFFYNFKLQLYGDLLKWATKEDLEAAESVQRKIAALKNRGIEVFIRYKTRMTRDFIEVEMSYFLHLVHLPTDIIIIFPPTLGGLSISIMKDGREIRQGSLVTPEPVLLENALRY